MASRRSSISAMATAASGTGRISARWHRRAQAAATRARLSSAVCGDRRAGVGGWGMQTRTQIPATSVPWSSHLGRLLLAEPQAGEVCRQGLQAFVSHARLPQALRNPHVLGKVVWCHGGTLRLICKWPCGLRGVERLRGCRSPRMRLVEHPRGGRLMCPRSPRLPTPLPHAPHPGPGAGPPAAPPWQAPGVRDRPPGRRRRGARRAHTSWPAAPAGRCGRSSSSQSLEGGAESSALSHQWHWRRSPRQRMTHSISTRMAGWLTPGSGSQGSEPSIPGPSLTGRREVEPEGGCGMQVKVGCIRHDTQPVPCTQAGHQARASPHRAGPRVQEQHPGPRRSEAAAFSTLPTQREGQELARARRRVDADRGEAPGERAQGAMHPRVPTGSGQSEVDLLDGLEGREERTCRVGKQSPQRCSLGGRAPHAGGRSTIAASALVLAVEWRSGKCLHQNCGTQQVTMRRPVTHLATGQCLPDPAMLGPRCSRADEDSQQGWAVACPPSHPRLCALQQGVQADKPLGCRWDAGWGVGGWRPRLRTLHTDGADAQRPGGQPRSAFLAVQAGQGPSLHRASHAHAVTQAHVPCEVIQEHHPDGRLGQGGLVPGGRVDPGGARLACVRGKQGYGEGRPSNTRQVDRTCSIPSPALPRSSAPGS